MSYKPKILELAAGGTNANLVADNGGIFYSTATAAAILGSTSTANQPLLSGASGAPGWSTATYPGSTTINRILYSSANNVVSQLVTANNGLLVTDSSGAPSILAGPGTTGQMLQSNAAAAPSFSTATFPGTAGSTGTILRSDGTNWVATTATYPATATVSQILYASASNVISGLATANNGTVVTSNTGVPSVLAGPGTTGNILQSNAAAAPSFSTATYPATTTINQVLYSSANNVVAGITAANNGTMISGTTGVPSWLANGTTGQVLTATTGSPPSWAAAASGGISTVTGQRFTSSGAFTYTPTASMKYVIVELVGGGGGSGGAAIAASVAASGSGGAGGYAKFILTAAQVGASLSGSVGAAGAAGATGNNAGGNGGNTTLATAAAWTVNGGTGGAGSANGTGITTAGGAGGAVTTGTGTILATSTGQSGDYSAANASAFFEVAGAGGSNPLGQGGPMQMIPVSGGGLVGAVGTGFGAGASGTLAYSTGATQTGAAGTVGIAIFTEFV